MHFKFPSVKLIQHHYGKARVHVLKVFRAGKQHFIKELDVQLMLQGDFEAAFTKADNRLVVATDSVKNTINVLAKQKLGADKESFGLVLGEHFLKTYEQVSRVEVSVMEHCWGRITVKGKPHAHSFSEKGAANPFAKIVCTRNESVVESGIKDLLILKTTASGFENFLRDEFTTLPETNDRILATKLEAIWTYRRTPRRYSGTNKKILERDACGVCEKVQSIRSGDAVPDGRGGFKSRTGDFQDSHRDAEQALPTDQSQAVRPRKQK